MWIFNNEELSTSGSVYISENIRFYDVSDPESNRYYFDFIDVKQEYPNWACFPMSTFGNYQLGYKFILQRQIDNFQNISIAYYRYKLVGDFEILEMHVDYHQHRRKMIETPPPPNSNLYVNQIDLYDDNGTRVYSTNFNYAIDQNLNCYYVI
jgi:hypothetical protein